MVNWKGVLKRVGLGALIFLVVAVVLLTVWVEREADYVLEPLAEGGDARALILYHPSRDAGFSDELTIALAAGFQAAGFSVDRATVTRETPDRWQDYDLMGVVSNTYFWMPDRPTLRYLRRARLDGIPVIGIMGGAGSTGRAERILAARLEDTGAEVIRTRSFWILRPNDETRMDEPNRSVAMDLARELARRSAFELPGS